MGKRILLADDSVTIQKVVELTFMEEDYEVIAVGNGDEAVAELDAAAPDLLIADVHMPGANGYQVCRHARDAYANLPVLLLVGTFEPFDEGEAEAAGANGFLKKPFDSQELLRRVEDLLAATDTGEETAAPKEAESAPEEDQIWDDSEEEAVEAEAAEEPSPVEIVGFQAEPVVEAMTETAEEEPSEEASGDEDEEPTFDADSLPDELPEMLPSDDLAEEPSAEPVAGMVTEEEWEEPTAEPEPEKEELAAIEPEVPAAASAGGVALSDEDVDRIARRVADLLGDRILRDIAWEVVPDLAELVIKDRIRELEQQLE